MVSRDRHVRAVFWWPSGGFSASSESSNGQGLGSYTWACSSDAALGQGGTGLIKNVNGGRRRGILIYQWYTAVHLANDPTINRYSISLSQALVNARVSAAGAADDRGCYVGVDDAYNERSGAGALYQPHLWSITREL